MLNYSVQTDYITVSISSLVKMHKLNLSITKLIFIIYINGSQHKGTMSTKSALEKIAMIQRS